MPDLLGLPSADVNGMLGDLQADEDLDLRSAWLRPLPVRRSVLDVLASSGGYNELHEEWPPLARTGR